MCSDCEPTKHGFSTPVKRYGKSGHLGSTTTEKCRRFPYINNAANGFVLTNNNYCTVDGATNAHALYKLGKLGDKCPVTLSASPLTNKASTLDALIRTADAGSDRAIIYPKLPICCGGNTFKPKKKLKIKYFGVLTYTRQL